MNEDRPCCGGGTKAKHSVCACGHFAHDHDWWGGGPCTVPWCECKAFVLGTSLANADENDEEYYTPWGGKED